MTKSGFNGFSWQFRDKRAADEFLCFDDGSCDSAKIHPKAPEAESFIYVFKSQGLVKIGFSNDPARRARRISQQTPFLIEIVECFSIREDLACKFETICHNHFRQFRRRGEWFYIKPEDAVNYISKNIDDFAEGKFAFENTSDSAVRVPVDSSGIYDSIWRDAVRDEASLSSTTKLLLLILQTYIPCNNDYCSPSIYMLSKASSLPEKSVTKHLKIAEESRYIIIENVYNNDEGWPVVSYVRALPAEAADTIMELNNA